MVSEVGEKSKQMVVNVCNGVKDKPQMCHKFVKLLVGMLSSSESVVLNCKTNFGIRNVSWRVEEPLRGSSNLCDAGRWSRYDSVMSTEKKKNVYDVTRRSTHPAGRARGGGASSLRRRPSCRSARGSRSRRRRTTPVSSRSDRAT